MITQNSKDPKHGIDFDHPHGGYRHGDDLVNAQDMDIAGFVEEAIGDEHLRIDEDFGCGFVRLKSSEAQRRQAAQDIRCSEDILIELLRNSRDAGAGNIFIATSRSADERVIVVIDDGTGLPREMFLKVFEPRVTSKLDSSHMDTWGLHGRGMALYSIKVNTRSSEIMLSEIGFGTALKVVSDLGSLSEKADQSTFPTFELSDSKYIMRGPKNLIRCAAEFALEHRGELNVYFGSAAEILSTMYHYGCSTIPVAKRAIPSNRDQEKLFKRVCFCPDSEALAAYSVDLGLDVSERTARRVIDGKVRCLPSLIEILSSKAFPKMRSKDVRRHDDSALVSDEASRGRLLHLSDDDISELSDKISMMFSRIAERYYLDENVKPNIVCKNGEMRITIPTLNKDE